MRQILPNRINNFFISSHQSGEVLIPDGLCSALSATDYKHNKLVLEENMIPDKIKDMVKINNDNAKHQQDLLQTEDDICRTIPAGTHGSTPHLLKTVVSEEPKIINPLKGVTGESWFFEQEVYDPNGIARGLKAESGSGNIPKIIEDDGELLKEKLCNQLIEQGLVEEGDVVKHSYTNKILNGEKKAIEKSGEMITLTTRPDCVGVVVRDLKGEVCDSMLNNNLVEPMDVVDVSYSNSRLAEIENGYVSKKNSDNSISPTITTAIDNYGICVDSTATQDVCNLAIETGSIKEYEMFNPSYASSRKEEIMSGNMKIDGDGTMSPTITTRVDNYGVCVGTYEEPHGWNPGGVKETDTCDSLRSSHLQQIAIEEPTSCRSVGRDPNNPKSRKKADKYVQQIELREDGVSGTLTTFQKDNYVIEPVVERVGQVHDHQSGQIISDKGVAFTIMAGTHGYGMGNVATDSVYTDSEKALFTEDGNIKRYANSDIIDKFDEGTMATTTFPNGYGHGTRVTKESQTLTCSSVPSVKKNLRIRKLTPKECWRLMGFEDEDVDAAKAAGVSDSQLYKQAGNSIVVNCLEAIFNELL